MEKEGYSALYEKHGERIICQLCRHYCQLKENQIGLCGVNKNEEGRLKNLVYGKVSALHVDPIEKKPLYHFLPGSMALSLGTVGCNLQCPFCQNWQISQTSELDTSTEISPEKLVVLARENGCQTIAYTYNEPTIFYPFAKETARLAKAQGIKNIFVSNGMETPEMIAEMQGVIDGFNIDLKSFDPEYYKKYLKGSLEGVLDTLKRLVQQGFWVEVTTLIVPGDNDSDEELHQIAAFIAEELGLSVPWHISAFSPNYKVEDKSYTPLSTLQRAKEIGESHGLHYIYMGNILSDSSTYCPQCHTVLIERQGYTVTENRLREGACPVCQREIEGVWR
jgi:pyruvate formate lyase activating enzyme